MKPRDLKRAFTFDTRRPLFQDQIFYVPHYFENYRDFVLPAFSELFQNEHPVCIEYCSGNGDWIAEKAKSEPFKNWIAVEKRFDRVQKIWSKAKNGGLSNLLIVSGEACTFTTHYLQNGSIEEVYINFPDPWPKNKHAKNRLLNPKFLDELTRILKGGKKMTFVTDDFTYLTQTIDLLRETPGFCPHFAAPYYQLDLSSYGTSWFENLWREKGKDIHYTQFVKQ